MAALKLDAEDDPKNPRDDDELTVFGVNSGQHMIIYNTSLTSIAFYGRQGDGVGEFEKPHGIAADRAGRVVVADTGNRRLHLLQYADDRLTHVRFVAGSASGRTLGEATGVALEGGEIYACAGGAPHPVFDLRATCGASSARRAPGSRCSTSRSRSTSSAPIPSTTSSATTSWP
jgi:hypothetical protein